MIKNTLKKAIDDKKDLYLALLGLKNTPQQTGSPTQLMANGKKNQDPPPTHRRKNPAIPKVIKPQEVINGRLDKSTS